MTSTQQTMFPLDDPAATTAPAPPRAPAATAPLILATDGSALNNPGPAGWAYFIDEDSWASGGFARETNNVAELTAVLEALRAVPDDVPLEIRADSQYTINCLAGMNGKPAWVQGWRRRGWRTAAGAPVANQELIRTIDDLLTRRRAPVRFVWVKAHRAVGGDPWNEAADARAQAAAQAAKAGRPGLAGPGYTR